MAHGFGLSLNLVNSLLLQIWGGPLNHNYNFNFIKLKEDQNLTLINIKTTFK